LTAWRGTKAEGVTKDWGLRSIALTEILEGSGKDGDLVSGALNPLCEKIHARPSGGVTVTRSKKRNGVVWVNPGRSIKKGSTGFKCMSAVARTQKTKRKWVGGHGDKGS